MPMNDPRELFLHELKDVYFAENALVKALPEMISEASDKELSKGLDNHLDGDAPAGQEPREGLPGSR